MNILFLSTRSPYPLISGHSLRTYHILKGAAKKHNVTLVTFIQLEDELNKEHLDHLRSFCRAVYPFRIPTDSSASKLFWGISKNLLSPLPFVAEKYDVSAMRDKIREIIVKESIDLVHVDMLPLTQYINEFKGIPKLLVNHNVESVRLFRWFKEERNLFKKTYLGFQYFKLRSYEKKAVYKFDACVVVSEYDKILIQKIAPRAKLFVVPNGTDTSYFSPNDLRCVPNSMIWVGHMDVHTNRDAALYFWREIFPIILKQSSDVKMTFLGTSPPKQIVKRASNNSGVRVTGFVTDIRPYVQESAVFVVPIRIGSGTRLKILDAMAMGKAIVSTSVGCEGIKCTDGKDILIADNPGEFASKVISVLKNRGLRDYLGQNARKLAETYDWENITKLQEVAYQEVVNKQRN